MRKPPAAATSRAVLIGVHTFRELGPLNAVRNNVPTLRQLLTEPGIGGLPPEHCLGLLQPESPVELLDCLHRAAAEATDTLIVYYSGHGLVDACDESQFYLALPDSSSTGQWYRTLRYTDVREALQNSPAAHKVVILDCCYSARALAGGMGAQSAVPVHALAALADIENTCVLTAAAENVAALCPPGAEYSVFTGELIALLRNGLTGPLPGAEDDPPGEHRALLDLGLVYRVLRASLADKHGPLPQLGTRNLGSDVVLARNRAYTGPSPERVEEVYAVPDTLVSPDDVFVGREDELAELTEAARQVSQGGGAAVRIVHGMGGLGKTALLRQAASRVAADFPDARFEIDLEGFTPGRSPRNPDHIITEHLQRVGYRPADIPGTPAARQEEWRAWLSGRRVVLLLDNAHDARQIRPLLPGAGSRSLALVSSRSRFDGVEAHRSSLVGKLPRPDSVDLLLKVGNSAGAGGTDDELDEIAARCCDIPVALRAVGALLRDTPASTVLAGMCPGDPLRHVPDGYEAVELAFSTSYNHLPEELRTLLWYCAWHPGPDFGRDSIAAMADRQGAGIGLSLLVRRSLLLAEADRLAFHDLFLQHALDAAAPRAAELRDEARRRLYGFVLGRLSAALVTVYGPGPDGPKAAGTMEFLGPEAAREWLVSRSAELESVAAEALDDQWEGAVRLAGETARWLRFDDRVEQARALSESMHAAADIGGDTAGRISALNCTAETHRLQSDHQQAHTFHQQALRLARATGNQVGETSALNGIGYTHQAQDAYTQARTFHEQALELARATGDRVGETDALYGIGYRHQMLDEYAQARTFHEQVLELARATGSRRDQTNVLNSLGDILRMQGDHEPARAFHQQALELARRTGSRRDQTYALNGIGYTHRMQGNHEQARTTHQQALDIARATGHHIGQANALNGIAHTHRMQDNHEQARTTHQQALDIARATDNFISQANALNGIAHTHRMQDNHEQARTTHQQALDIARGIGDHIGQTNALTGIAHTHAAQHDYVRARDHYRRAEQLFEAIGLTESAERCREWYHGLGGE